MTKIILSLILTIIIIALENLLFTIFGAHLLFFSLLVDAFILVALLASKSNMVIYGFLAGILYDLLSGSLLGTHALLVVATMMLIKTMMGIWKKSNPVYLWILMFLATCFYKGILLLSHLILSHQQISLDIGWMWFKTACIESTALFLLVWILSNIKPFEKSEQLELGI